MPCAKFSHYIHLHILVFIAGFTAILGELISIGSIPLVWYRMVMATALMLLYIAYKKRSLKITRGLLIRYSFAGILIALHWITFFESIKQSNVSIALAMFASGAFFASFIEPFFYKRNLRLYEIVFGIIVIIGVSLITHSELKYLNGILLGIASAIFSAWFAVLNGKYVEKGKASVIAVYEFLSGITFISLFILIFDNGYINDIFSISASDLSYLFVLATICTAYAFIAVIELMKYIKPYTVVLTYNLEPIYGIIMAVLLFPKKEIMGIQFYTGAVLILAVVFLNGYISRRLVKKNAQPPIQL